MLPGLREELKAQLDGQRAGYGKSPTGAIYRKAPPTSAPALPVVISRGWIARMLGAHAGERYSRMGPAGLQGHELNVIADAIGHAHIRPANVPSPKGASDISMRRTDELPKVGGLALATTAGTPANTQIAPARVGAVLGADAQRRWEELGARGLTPEERGRLSRAQGLPVLSASRAEVGGGAQETIDSLILGAGRGVQEVMETVQETSFRAGAGFAMVVAGAVLVWWLVNQEGS